MVQRKEEMDKQRSTIQYTEDKRLRNTNPTKNRSELKCSGRDSRSLSNTCSGTRHVTFVTNTVIIHKFHKIVNRKALFISVLHNVNGLILVTLVHYTHPFDPQNLGRKNLVQVYNPHQLLSCLCGGQMRE